jgi:nucleotide-binding universal stress UspA family protein
VTEWKRIACAVEFSEQSRVAMLKAAELALRFEGDLTLVYVRAVPPTVGTDMLVVPQEVGEMEGVELEKTIAMWREEAERISGRPVTTAVLRGDPAAELVRFVRERELDVLLIGTHGRKGLARLVLGSVAEKVVRSAPCSVLVARR